MTEPAARQPGGLFRLTTERPVAMAMLFLTMLVFGWSSLQRLPTNLMPDISYPRVTVRAEYAGAAPEDVEERVTKRLHETLSVLPHLEAISSVSRAGLCDVTLEFAWGTNITFAIQDIRERIDRTLLPLEVGTPIILRYDPTLDPILVVGLTGGRDLLELRSLAEDRLAPAISTVPGVAAVRVRGGLQDEIQVRLDADRLATHGLRAADVADRLAAENVNLASGTVLEGDTEYLVRILNEYVSPDEIARTVLFRDGESLVRLSDVGHVLRTPKERDVITRIDGQESVQLQVFKEADANIVDLASRARDAVFGDAGQRAWIAELRAGRIEDPETRLDAFRAKVAADPRMSAAMARLHKPMSFDEPAADAPAEPPLGEEEQALQAELAAEEDAILADLAAQDRAFDYLGADLPADVTLTLLSDQSRFIQDAIEEVKWSGIEAAIYSVLILYLFLGRLTPTLIIAVSIPVSIIVTFTPLQLSGTTLNVMSLGGLALGVGMVVDNANVVIEAIEQAREQGLGRVAAAIAGAREVAGACTAATLTTIAVFAPIVFVEGIAGQMFRDQAITVVVSMLVSLVVALLLMPMLASLSWGQDGTRDPWAPLAAPARLFVSEPAAWHGLHDDFAHRNALMGLLFLPGRAAQFVLEGVGRLLYLALGMMLGTVLTVLWLLAKAWWLVMWVPTQLFLKFYASVAAAYPPFIRGVTSSPVARGLTLLIAIGLFAWSVWTVPRLGSELVPEVHQGEIVARLMLPVGTPIEATDRVASQAEAALRGHPDVAWTATTVGVPRDEVSQADEGEHSARIAVGLRPQRDMAAAEERVMAVVRERLAALPDLRELRFERPALFTVRTPIQVEIKGEDLSEIAATAERVEAALRDVPGLRDIRSSVQPGSPEVMLSFDRDLLVRYGLDTRAVATTVSDLVRGRVATRFSDADQKLDVLVQVDKGQLQSIEDLLSLPVRQTGTPRDRTETQTADRVMRELLGDGAVLDQGRTTPLAALAHIEVREGPREIRRIWGQRAALVSAALSGFDVGSATEQIERSVTAIERDTGLVIELGGQSSEMKGALTQMFQALLLAVFLVYVVMASIFESLLQPLIILLTMPLAMVGVVGALWVLDIPLSVVVYLGCIILAGIVVANAIVLIDAINRRRRLDGQPLDEAIWTACQSRLRPILMTTLTTVIGLVPLTGWMPWASGEGLELRAPMAIAVIAGLSVSTLLTLVVIPVVYASVERALLRGKAEAA